jgi:hypothetical protein
MSKAETDQQQEILPNPKFYPPEQEVTFLTFGLDEQGHTLRLLVNGQQHWVRVGFKDVDSMYRGQEMVRQGIFKSASMLHPSTEDGGS